jgi:hypothetical protein
MIAREFSDVLASHNDVLSPHFRVQKLTLGVGVTIIERETRAHTRKACLRAPRLYVVVDEMAS